MSAAGSSRRGIIAGCLLGAATGWNISNIGAIASELADAYGVALATIGLLATMLFVTHTAFQLPAGRLSDRIGALRAGVLALAILCAGNALALSAQILWVAAAGRALCGVGTALAFIAGSALVRESGGSPLAQGLFGGLGTGAAGLALAVVPLAEASVGWRAPYVSALACAAVAGLFILAARLPAPARRRSPQTIALRRLIRDRRLHRLSILYSASYGVSIVVGNWVNELLERHTGLAPSRAALIGSTTLVLGVIARPLGGWLSRAHPDRARAVIAASLVAGPAGIAALALGGPTWSLVLGGVLFGIASGLPFAAAFTGAAAANPDAAAASVAVVNTVANGFVLVGTPLVGLTFDLPGNGQIGFAAAALVALLALTVLPDRTLLGLGRRPGTAGA